MIKKFLLISIVSAAASIGPSSALVTKNVCKSDLDYALNKCESKMGISGSNTTGDILSFSNYVIDKFSDKLD